jgi:hypothetical protein
MSKSNFSEDFKRDSVRQITERGYYLAVVVNLYSRSVIGWAIAEPTDHGRRIAGSAHGGVAAKAEGQPDDLLVREPCTLHSVRLFDATDSTKIWRKFRGSVH